MATNRYPGQCQSCDCEFCLHGRRECPEDTTPLPHGWTGAEANKAYAEWSSGAESGRSFEGFITYQWSMENQ